MSRDTLSLYKKYATNGAPSIFSRNQFVLHQDKIYKFIYPVTDRNQLNWNEVPEPIRSEYWKEEILPTILFKGESAPEGLKIIGDRWQNPKTNKIYTWIKSGSRYIWSS